MCSLIGTPSHGLNFFTLFHALGTNSMHKLIIFLISILILNYMKVKNFIIFVNSEKLR